MHSKIGIAIAGLGFGESVHLPALKTSNSLQAKALWHPNKERVTISSERNNLKGYEDWELLLNDPEIEGIIIATPPEPRFKLALKALQAGKHLLLEKPVALTSDEISELQKIALRKRLSVAVDFEYRAVPLFLQAKEILSQKLLGDPWFIKFDWIMSSRANESRKWNWYSDANQGGGVIGALGTHAIDIIHWLFGSTKTVHGTTSTAIKERPYGINEDLREVTSDDICFAQLQIENFNNTNSLPIQLTMSSVSREGRGFWLEAYGSKGTMVLGSNNQKDYVHGFGLWLAESGQKLKAINPNKKFAFGKTWEDGRIAPVARVQDWWSESINTGTPMIPGLHEGLLSQKVCEKIHESNISGIKLPMNSSI